MRLRANPIMLLLCVIASSADSDKKARFFAAGLVAKMTLEEKIGHRSQIALNIQHDEPVEEPIRKGKAAIGAATVTAGAVVKAEVEEAL